MHSVVPAAGEVESGRGGLVLVDEVEEGLHRSALAGVRDSLAAAAGAGGTQLVVSTHSGQAVAAGVAALCHAETSPRTRCASGW